MPEEGFSEFGESLAVGHRPLTSLTPQDETLFRAFQSNLLSLISHELRTPLMGILNAVGVLDDEASGGESAGIPAGELIKMARQNAQRLQRTLTTLLDMAALESHTFHAHLREVELTRMIRNRIDLNKSIYRDHEVRVEFEAPDEMVALADPQKISRALDLCLEILAFRAKRGTTLKVRISSSEMSAIQFEFEMDSDNLDKWQQAWLHGQVGFEGGVSSPASAFAGVMQTEKDFLTRTEEGLGSELLLIHEITRLHRGKLIQQVSRGSVTLELLFPTLASEEMLNAVLTSRAYALTNQTASVALILIKVPKGREIESFRAEVRKLLYRTTDGAYSLPQRDEIAIVMDDYRRDDLPKLLERIRNAIGIELEFATAHCPSDVADPTLLFAYAKSQTAS
jgi:hypothetical protein